MLAQDKLKKASDTVLSSFREDILFPLLDYAEWRKRQDEKGELIGFILVPEEREASELVDRISLGWGQFRDKFLKP